VKIFILGRWGRDRSTFPVRGLNLGKSTSKVNLQNQTSDIYSNLIRNTKLVSDMVLECIGRIGEGREVSILWVTQMEEGLI